jgi:hypothetical protein
MSTPMLERDWQNQVISIAHIFKWRVAHFRALKTKHGWKTPVQADGAGFPDLVLVRERVVWAELKRDDRGSKLRPDQVVWQQCLELAGCEFYVWRPSDAEHVLATLRKRVA